MLKNFVGREIKTILWGQNEGVEAVEAEEGGKIVLENDFHGGYDLDWGVVYDKSGKETSRWNLGNADGIIWKP